MAAEKCSSAIKNISFTECQGQYGQIITAWLDEVSTGLSLTDALTESNWTNKINAATGARLYIMAPNKSADEVTRNVEDPVIQVGNTGKRRKVRNGKVDYVFRYDNLTICQMNRIKTFDGQTMYAYFVTKNEAIIAQSDGTNLLGVPVDVYVTEPTSPETEDGLWSIEVHAFVIPTSDYFNGVVLPYDQAVGAWRPTDVEGIQSVEITYVSSTVTGTNDSLVVNIDAICDGTDITALTTAGDFVIKLASSGAEMTINSVSNVGNVYTFDVTGFTAAAHTIALRNQPTMTVKGYETEADTTFTPGT